MDLPPSVDVKDAFLYLSFFDLDNDERTVTVDGYAASPWDPFEKPPMKAGPFCNVRYNMFTDFPSSLVQKVTHTYKVDVYTPASGFSGVYGAMIVVIYEWVSVLGAPMTEVLINDGCMWLFLTSGTTTFQNPIDPTDVTEAKLIIMVQGGEPGWPFDDDELWFNGNLLATNPLGGNGFWDVDEFDVKLLLLPGTNTVTAVSDPTPPSDGFIADVAILAIKHIWWPVGGVSVPVNMLVLLAPWISLGSLITVTTASVAYVKHRKRQQD